MAEGRQIYYYEFEDNKKIPQALSWIKDYCDKKLTLEATLDLDKASTPFSLINPIVRESNLSI